MEQPRYWMSTKRKYNMSLSNNPSSYGDSWEEQAFAEDAAGALGGCIWPPRSYTCSFCRREFRSAQALGGHMNVHRRDRARMKQSPPSSNPSGHDHQVFVPPPLPHHHNSHVQYPSQICTFMYNPNSDSDSGAPIRVSSQKNLPTHHHPSFSPIVQEENKNKLSSPPSSWSNLVAEKYSCLSNVKNDEEKKLKSIDFKKDEERNLEVMLNNSSFRPKQDHIVETNCKRRRVDHQEDNISFANLFPKTSSSMERCRPQSEALERIPSAIEELDLELRL